MDETQNKNYTDGIVLVNKPKGITSFDIIRIIKKRTGVKKIGHGGTLDKNAHGLVIIGVGKGTKQLSQALDWDKTYVFHMVLGVWSDTHDWVGHRWKYKLIPDHVTKENLEKLLKNKFTGLINQKPPIYSALKKKGKEYYKYALEGKELDIETRQVSIYEISLASFVKKTYQAEAVITIKCSKGTYVRSLARDIGIELGTYGVIKDLCRITIGPHSISDSVSLDLLNSFEDLETRLI
ncbi:MAG: tRNA pseudouridine(55) synthase TruB [Caldisericia bacterium]|nr:tRNA pseudouridine(55) synthase TruB [Caldisericia bacterium]